MATSQEGYIEEIDGRKYLTIPIQSGAFITEVFKRLNATLGHYMDVNYRREGFPGLYSRSKQTRKYPLAHLHALFPDRIVYEVEV